MKYLALDPGQTVGWAMYSDVSKEFAKGQFPAQSTWEFLESTKPALLVVEAFFYRPMLTKVDLTPAEVIGVVKEWARQHIRRIHWQSPAQAKHLWTNERLQEVGRYTPAMTHGNDAMRHLLYHLHRTGEFQFVRETTDTHTRTILEPRR